MQICLIDHSYLMCLCAVTALKMMPSVNGKINTELFMKEVTHADRIILSLLFSFVVSILDVFGSVLCFLWLFFFIFIRKLTWHQV